MDNNLATIVESLGKLLLKKQLFLATSESCTGGWIAQAITSVAGSSKWFDRGFVCYSNEAKHEMLDVPLDLIAKRGAVSEEVAATLAKSTILKSRAQISIAVSGIAGPEGGTAEKPLGTVWFGWGYTNNKHIDIVTTHKLFHGNREQIRYQAVEFALKQLVHKLSDEVGD
jgi:nicotinamide-nucleotide amidase